MIRSLMVASAVLVMAVPAHAEERAAADSASATVGKLQLAQLAAETQARKHLLLQGYTGVSSLEQDSNGRWTGTATKDGKPVIVAIKVPVAGAAAH